MKRSRRCAEKRDRRHFSVRQRRYRGGLYQAQLSTSAGNTLVTGHKESSVCEWQLGMWVGYLWMIFSYRLLISKWNHLVPLYIWDEADVCSRSVWASPRRTKTIQVVKQPQAGGKIRGDVCVLLVFFLLGMFGAGITARLSWSDHVSSAPSTWADTGLSNASPPASSVTTCERISLPVAIQINAFNIYIGRSVRIWIQPGDG